MSDLYELGEALDEIGSALDEGRRPKVGHLRVVYCAAQAHCDRTLAEAASWEPPADERPEHAALADGTARRPLTARELGLVGGSDEARWAPPPDPDDLLARLHCGCDPDQGHTCQEDPR